MGWSRDAAVAEFIRYMDQPERRDRWDLLTKKDWEAVRLEAKKAQDFEYAARNYYWITDKDERDVMFSLWPAQDLILEKFYDLKQRGRPVKILVLKARQLGASLLIDAMMIHRCMTSPNVNGLLVSKTRAHSALLFSAMLHILDYLPWWLKPMVAARKYEEGLWFENPVPELRSQYPGLNSRILVQAANETTGVGEGTRLSAIHGSEIASWEFDRAKKIIDGDMVHAMPEGPNVFGFLESTGAMGYLEKLWRASVDLGDKAEWYPLFLPWFFEKQRFLPPPVGWKPQDPEKEARETAARSWTRCTTPDCHTYRPITWAGESTIDTSCRTCKTGKMQLAVLTDGQLCYMEDLRINRERKGIDSVKELHAELCLTPEESFQLFGYNVFPQECHDFVAHTVDHHPIAKGTLDKRGNFHGVKMVDGKVRCWTETCIQDHRYEEEYPLWIWEWAKHGAQYAVGVDTADGLGGDADYSVAWVNRIGKPPSPDVHVATFRSNTIDPGSFALPVALLGRMYNTALMSIEMTGGDTVANMVRINYSYPNIYRWKHLDANNMLTARWGWVTQINTKPRLWQTMIRYLKAKAWIVKDPRLAHEMKHFQKEKPDSIQVGAAAGEHDDLVMAAGICLYTTHELDMDEDFRNLPIGPSTTIAKALEWAMRCNRCNAEWEAENPEKTRCPQCGCRIVHGRLKARFELGFDDEELAKQPNRESYSTYDEV